MKEFYGNVSLILDLNFSIEANSIEEAKEKIWTNKWKCKAKRNKKVWNIWRRLGGGDYERNKI